VTPRLAIFLALLVFCLTPWCSPPIALAIGLAFALTVERPFPTATATRLLLQSSVVGLGFGMSFGRVLEAGRTGVAFTLATIVGTLVIGWVLGRVLRVSRGTAHLISSGTAICGGSAIAAVGPLLGATDEEMSVSLGTIFILNAVALLAFPPIGRALAMTQTEFGVWAAIAIHDTSSVIGAASAFGSEALAIATTVKLTRALWIIPLALGTAVAFRRDRSRVAIPWFILLFVLASLARTSIPAPPEVWDLLVRAARTGLTVTLFLIGASLSRESLARVGPRPLLLGTALWLLISAAGFWGVRAIL
jgi:uncharacterized integral membrane protein (TIGR00698 family)